jgi:hypothetical protein
MTIGLTRRFVLGAFQTLMIAAMLFAPQRRAVAQQTFGVGGTVTIPAVGVAATYPVTFNVGGLKEKIAHIALNIHSFRHTCYSDVGLLLVGPQGQTCLLDSRCGGCTGNLFAVNITFDDDAPGPR